MIIAQAAASPSRRCFDTVGPNAIIGAAVLWAIPVGNAVLVVRRIDDNRPILFGDRSHLYDILHRRIGLARTLALGAAAADFGIAAACAHP